MTGGSLPLERLQHPNFEMGIWGEGSAAIFPVNTVYGAAYCALVHVQTDTYIYLQEKSKAVILDILTIDDLLDIKA